MSFAVFPALIGGALLAACDDSATPASRLDAGDAAADTPRDISYLDTFSLEYPPDAGLDFSRDVPQPAACPAAVPSGACSVDESVECTYQKDPCPGGKVLERLCTCTNGMWSCIQDLGCPRSKPLGGTPEQACGACPSAPGASTCTYPVESCPAADDLLARCTCAGNTWSCARDQDCHPANTCRDLKYSINCVTNGLVNTGPFCPPGFVQGACTGVVCQPGNHEYRRIGCSPPPGGHSRSGVCVHGTWACPIGYTVIFHPI